MLFQLAPMRGAPCPPSAPYGGAVGTARRTLANVVRPRQARLCPPYILWSSYSNVVMAGLVPAIHDAWKPWTDVDARDEPGHDEYLISSSLVAGEAAQKQVVRSAAR
ncbi:hypothetical protein SSBR45G_50600 [Bradyrhizobium sp. SSBR45G]|nr:hypothetical protein SSBR45G_50600 [Bradyrhizobium sp. SSBR45G]GLH87540.1 hypothetical protein SSBR45R_50000 [Bradyrhizobium sp. SSBR45R]